MAAMCMQVIYGALAYLYIKKTAEGITSQPVHTCVHSHSVLLKIIIFSMQLIRNTEKPVVSCGKASIAYMLAW